MIEDSITYRSADEAWLTVVRDLLTGGSLCVAQNDAGKSLELLGYTSRVDMGRCVLTHPARKLGYKFQAAEAWWILSGDDRVETISPYSKTISQFSDDGVKFFGAYGPKVVPQLRYVVDELRRDPQSRRAVLNVWRESPPVGSKDYPCTLSLQFLVRDGKVHCAATMRSSDVWLGWPYDVFNFSCVAAAVALALDARLTLGQLTLTVGSQHVYLRNFPTAVAVSEDHETVGQTYPPLDCSAFDDVAHLVSTLKKWADGEGSLAGLISHHRSKRVQHPQE